MAFDFNPPQFGSSYDADKQRRLVDDCIRAFESVQSALTGFDVTGETIVYPFQVTGEFEFVTGGFLHFGQTDFNVGTGWWLAEDEFSVGDPAGDRITWNGSLLNAVGTFSGSIDGGDIFGDIPDSSVPISAQGWTITTPFSATDADTVQWGSGTLTLGDGTTYSINAGSTGNMTARTYVYLDVGISTVDLQVSTTASDAVGGGRLLIAVCEDTTTEAFFQVFSGIGGLLVTASEIAANTITANEIAAGAITAAQIQAGTITADRLAATLTLTQALIISTTGYLASGQTGFDTGVGYYADYNGGSPRFSIGDPAGDKLTWNAGVLTIVGAVSGIIDAGSLTGSIPVGTADISVSGWTTTCIFSVVDEDTVQWGGGQFVSANGNTYSIGAGSTGDMASRTYVYLDVGVSSTALQTSTTATDAVGVGRVLIAVCEPRTDRAFFQVFGGAGGLSIPGSDLYIGFTGLVNGDFELGVKTGWDSAVESDGTLVNLGSGAHRGSWVMEVPATGNQFSEPLPVGPGERVLGQAWAKYSSLDNPSNAQQFAIRFYDDTDSEISRFVLATANIGDTEWQFLRGYATAPSLSAYYVVDLGQAAGSGDWWWDDVGTVIAPRDSDIVLGDASGTVDLGSQISGTLTAAFAEAGLINSNVTINADGTLSGAGGGQASLNSLPGDIGTTQIEDDAITTAKIIAGAVTASEIAANTVTAAQIAALTITASQIAANTITASQIAASTITTTQIAANTIVAGDIAALTITAAEIAASTITGAKIAANTITATNIAANTITASEIAANTITANELASNSVTANEIAAGVITAAKMSSSISFVSQALTLGSGATFAGGQSAYDSGTGFFFDYNGGAPRVSIGDSSGDKILLSAGSISITGDLTFTNASGSFTPNWNGFTSDPTNDTVYYLDFGVYVLMWVESNFTAGTSNAVTMSWASSSIPAAIRPSSNVFAPIILVTDGGGRYPGAFGINSAGGGSFYVTNTAGASAAFSTSGFQNTSSKGIAPGAVWVYRKS